MAFGIARLHISDGLRSIGGENNSVDLSLFVLIYITNFINQLKFNDFLKTKSDIFFIGCTHFVQSIKSPHFPLRGKFGQPSKRKRVLCWSIYIINYGAGAAPAGGCDP